MNDENNETEEKSQGKITRRDFLKYSAGVAAVAAGATALMGRLPFPTGTSTAAQSRRLSGTPLVVMVKGDELTVMNGNDEIVVKDAALASAIAGKIA